MRTHETYPGLGCQEERSRLSVCTHHTTSLRTIGSGLGRAARSASAVGSGTSYSLRGCHLQALRQSNHQTRPPTDPRALPMVRSCVSTVGGRSTQQPQNTRQRTLGYLRDRAHRLQVGTRRYQKGLAARPSSGPPNPGSSDNACMQELAA